jgi:hypothetical protein
MTLVKVLVIKICIYIAMLYKFFVFFGIIICWLYKLTPSNQTQVTMQSSQGQEILTSIRISCKTFCWHALAEGPKPALSSPKCKPFSIQKQLDTINWWIIFQTFLVKKKIGISVPLQDIPQAVSKWRAHLVKIVKYGKADSAHVKDFTKIDSLSTSPACENKSCVKITEEHNT